MKRIIVIGAALLLAGAAQAQQVTDQELQAAVDACAGKVDVQPGMSIRTVTARKWKSGWEHCEAVTSEYEARDLARKAREDAGLTVSKGVAERLNQGK